MIVFVSHESNAYGGANMVLRSLREFCNYNNELFCFEKRNGARFSKFYSRYLKFLRLIVKSRRDLFFINSAANLDLAVICWILNLSFVLYIHETEEFLGRGKIKWLLLKLLQHKIITVDTRLSDPLPLSTYVGCPANFETIGAAKYKFSKDVVRFAVIGTVDKNKRQLEAIKLIHDSCLKYNYTILLIGRVTDFNYKMQILDYANLNRLNVDLIDSIPRSKLHSSYDVLVASSRFESFGMAVAEAIVLGKPVLVLDSSGYPNINFSYNNCFVDVLDGFPIDEIVLLCSNLRFDVPDFVDSDNTKGFWNRPIARINKYFEFNYGMRCVFRYI
jgi:glycosyltransferase involved in cell wall biosynthesis